MLPPYKKFFDRNLSVRQKLFQLTPLGKADYELKQYLKGKATDKEISRYQTALNHYRHIKLGQISLKILLYAGIVTSVATTFGLEQAQIIQQIASYIGVSIIFVLYAVTSYITMIRRESYHVQREILISRADHKK